MKIYSCLYCKSTLSPIISNFVKFFLNCNEFFDFAFNTGLDINPLAATTRGFGYKFCSKWRQYPGNRVMYN